MAGFLLIFPVLLGLLVAWEVVARLRRRSRRTADEAAIKNVGATDSEGHYAPELERRRRLDLGASRWPGPARW